MFEFSYIFGMLGNLVSRIKCQNFCYFSLLFMWFLLFLFLRREV